MDVFGLVEAERLRLAEGLEPLTADEWARPSLCGEWSNHEVAAHLNVPFTVKPIQFVVGMAKAFGNFDKVNARFAKELAARQDPAACIAGLRANAGSHFTPPGFGPEAPLTDTIVHGIDVLHTVGRSVDVAPEAYAVVLPFAFTRKASRAFVAVPLDGLRAEPDDLDLTAGDAGGAVIAGPIRAIIGSLAGRSACLDELSGDGAEVLRQRLA